MDNKKARIEWIDLMRAIAILLVALCHATESIYKLNLEGMMSLSFQSRIFCLACFTMGRLGVPLFLMITGSLILTRDFDDNSIKYFWRNKWIHLLICTLLWFLIYDLFLVLHNRSEISFLQLIDELIFLRHVNMDHSWYLPAILGLYILLPFVSSVLKKHDNKLFVFPILIHSFYSFGYTTLNAIYRVYYPGLPLSNQFSLGFSGAYYGIYILLGYFVSIGILKKINPYYIVIITVTAFVSAVFIQNWSYQNGYEYNVWYNDSLVLIASIGIYELASRVKNIQGYLAIKQISLYSFGVYLTHNIVKMIMADSIKELVIAKPIKVFLLWLLSFGIGFVVSILISKTPRYGKYILYMK